MCQRERERARDRWCREEGRKERRDIKTLKKRNGGSEREEGREEGEEVVPAHRGKRTPCLTQQSHISALFSSDQLVTSQTFTIFKGLSPILYYISRAILAKAYQNYDEKLYEI